jgi:cytochrome c oxidase subunit I+III
VARGQRSGGLCKPHSNSVGQWPVRLALLFAIPASLVAIAIDLWAQWQSGLLPDRHSYGAVVYTILCWQGFHVGILVIMGLYTIARSFGGLLDSRRRASFDSTMLMCHYTTGQGIVALALIHLFPRLLGTQTVPTSRSCQPACWPGC